MEKQKYKRPQINCIPVELESGIAAASAMISLGEEPQNPFTPGVELWGDEQSIDNVREEF